MRLIDVDALKSYIDACKVCENCTERSVNCEYDCDMPDYLTPQIERILDEQPTIDAEPIVHAHWRKSTDDWGCTYYKCSQCSIEYILINGTPANNDYLYCSHCGAKMDEEETKND